MQSASLSSLNKQSPMLRALSKLPRARLASRTGLRNATTAARRAQEGERAAPAQDQGALQQQTADQRGVAASRSSPSILTSPFSLTRDFAPLLPSRVSSLFRCAPISMLLDHHMHCSQAFLKGIWWFCLGCWSVFEVGKDSTVVFLTGQGSGAGAGVHDSRRAGTITPGRTVCTLDKASLVFSPATFTMT